MKKKAGFSLIELVAVIVILGLLSTIALPRFVDFSEEAREAIVEDTAGALSSASSLNHAQNISYDAGLTAIVPVTIDSCNDAVALLNESMPEGYYLSTLVSTIISGGGVTTEGGVSLCNVSYDSSGNGVYDNADRPKSTFVLHGVQ